MMVDYTDPVIWQHFLAENGIDDAVPPPTAGLFDGVASIFLEEYARAYAAVFPHTGNDIREAQFLACAAVRNGWNG